ncbi:conserved hypothetical protein; putative exported protein [Herminiimonas arsenicoxydans]|uniref:Uncharacterized protein n=1 Tax=Herminiimonas arsenicoxydans TaxID=204773 RepID=A4G5F4_HERAR|nr:conserved hypothetical protein; putative exported protein [Herminiimonas arsenicoxydans]
MNRTLKTLLLWLLVATLPIQGLAAAMQTSCGPAHHTALEVAVDDNAHHHDGGAMPDLDDAVAAHHSASGLSSTSDHTSTPHKHLSSACCVGAIAFTSITLFTPTYTSSELVLVSPSPLVTGFIPTGLERPPKRISA